jgi:hypothetical protein
LAGLLVGKTRKEAKVPYPYTSCSAAEVKEDTTGAKNKFNCAQRAHLNTLENVTVFLFTLLYVGLEFPKSQSAPCLIYCGRCDGPAARFAAEADPGFPPAFDVQLPPCLALPGSRDASCTRLDTSRASPSAA